jgi:hypothetical protein
LQQLTMRGSETERTLKTVLCFESLLGDLQP